MQLLRVASTMSYQGSPYSGPGDEYDFEDDGYDDLDEFREREDSLQQPVAPEDSDEDTEEASETEPPHNDDPPETQNERKEQIYQDKLLSFNKQLQQLEDGSHPEFLRRVKRLEHQLNERLRVNRIYKDHMNEVVEREYIAEKKAAAKEFEEKKVELRENLLSDFEEKRRIIEGERNSMELNGDSMEVKPVMKRILRRRANEPAPAPEKRRKPLTTTLTFQLDDRDIESDLRAIASPVASRLQTAHAVPRKHNNSTSDRDIESDLRAIASPVASRHHTSHAVPRKHNNSTSDRDIESDLRAIASPVTSRLPRKHNNSTSESPAQETNENATETRVEDGKLLYDRRWYHRGQSVSVEGREMPKFAGHIHAITDDAIWIKKATLERIRIYVSQLARGKVMLKRRSA